MSYTASRVGVLALPATRPARRCVRCDHPMATSDRATTPICRDCRVSDPAYVRMIKDRGEYTPGRKATTP